MKVRVYLATTEGPVQVERITRESARQSAICLKRTTKVLPASAGYDAFVKPPSGVIEREFGALEAGAYRLDVSGNIDDGESWQLGVFVAHALAADERLAGPEEAADAAVWLTGEVDNDLGVSGVAHVTAKLHASRAEFAWLGEQGVPVTVFVPRENRAAAEAAEVPGVRVVAVASTAEVWAELGLGAPRRPALAASRSLHGAHTAAADAEPARERGGGRRWTTWALALMVLVLAAAAALAFYTVEWRRLAAAGEAARLERSLATAVAGDDPLRRAAALAYRRWLEAPRPALPAPEVAALEVAALEVAVLERRAPEGKTCAAVHFGTATAVTVEVPRLSTGEFESSRHEGLCGLEFALEPGAGQLYAAAFVEVLSGRFIEAGPKPGVLAGGAPLSGRVSWSVDIPRRLGQALTYRIVVVTASAPVVEAAARLRASEDLERATAELAGEGATVLTASHKVLP